MQRCAMGPRERKGRNTGEKTRGTHVSHKAKRGGRATRSETYDFGGADVRVRLTALAVPVVLWHHRYAVTVCGADGGRG
jgi:hypothetical protein